MDKKKDVLEYLRNQQKAAEIEAKVNGVNIWVLLGAIALVGWQLISVQSTVWSDPELILRLLVVAVAFHMLISIIGESANQSDELRLSRTSHFDNSSSYLLVLYGVLIAAPNIGSMLQTKQFLHGKGLVAVFGLVAVVIGFNSIYRAMEGLIKSRF